MADTLTHDLLWRRHAEAEEWRGYLQVATDAWSGGGGFAAPHDAEGVGRDALPDGWRSYLIQHPQEDGAKYAWRVRNAVYPPLPRVVGETLLGFLFSRQPSRDGTATLLEEWSADADGAGNSLDTVLRLAATHAMLFPFGLLLVAAPDEQASSQAEAAEMGWAPYVDLIHPAMLFDWVLGHDGHFTAAKLVDKSEDGGIADERKSWTRARIYTIENGAVLLRTYRQDESGKSAHLIAERTINVPEIPLVLCRFGDVIVPDALCGPAPMRQVVDDSRGLFNDLSFLQEHTAAQVVALLTYQQEKTAQQEPLVVGTNNALTYPVTCERPDFIAPPPTVADTLFRAIEERVRRIYRLMRLEFVLNDAQQSPASGVARQYEFQSTNRALAAYAEKMAGVEREVARHVFRFYGQDGGTLGADYLVSWPDDFDVRDLDAAVRRTQDAMLIPFDSVTRGALLRQLREDLVHLTPAQRAASDRELAALDEVSATDKDILTASTDKAAVVSVNEARANLGLAPMAGGDMTVTERRTQIEVEAQVARQEQGGNEPSAIPPA